MDFPEDQLKELALLGTVSQGQEGGLTYFLIEGLKLPDSCSPETTDALLCPQPRDGYESRLFFAEQINGPVARNWNGQNVRILERNWHAFSWKVPAGLRLGQTVSTILSALAK
jgi:hypothetical protein